LAAQFATENFTGNKKAFVFYETDRDSILAKAYLDEIEANDFFAIRFERLTNESAQQIENSFIEKYEVRLDDQLTGAEIDSIRLLSGRLVKSKPLRNQKNGSLIRDQDGNPVNMIYEERFNVTEDSIGHMLVATSSNLLANHFIGISEVRNDSIKIIGYESWLDFPTISYKQLERLDISFISPTAFNSDNENYKRVHDKFIEKIGREPGEFHLRGYELLYQLGLLLDENGKYFQRGLGSNELIEGKVMYGLQFGPFKDNQVVPITKLENFKVVNLSNRKAEEVDKD